MKYNIISINDERQIWKDHIRKYVNVCEEVKIPSVDGTGTNIRQELTARGVDIVEGLSPSAFSVGEMGIWLSVYDCWLWCYEHGEELIVFEDDATPDEQFDDKFEVLYDELPPDWGYLALWVPDNQRNDYLYNCYFNQEGLPVRRGYDMTAESSLFNFGAEHLAKVYQGYGNVAMLYSPAGAERLLYRTHEVGIYSTLDCQIFQEAHVGAIAGYAPKPHVPECGVVRYHWPETTIHTTERFMG